MAQQTSAGQSPPLASEPQVTGQPVPVPAPALPTAPAAGAKEEKKKEDASQLVELYGKVYPQVMAPTSGLWHPALFSNRGATPAGTPVSTLSASPAGANGIMREIEFASSNSRFGLRGHQRLPGGDLRAVFQLETQFSIEGATNDAPVFGTRDSWVGLSSNRYGTLKLGRFDTPFKDYGDETSFLGVSSGNFTSTSAVFRRPGFGTSNASRFHERRPNAAQFESPELYGFDFAVQYSSDLARTATRDPHVWSAGLRWTRGEFEVAVAHEIHNDIFGGSRNVPKALSNFDDQSVNAVDRASALMLKYKLGIFTFEFDVNDKRYNEDSTNPGKFHSYRNNAYEAIWEARWTQNWRTAAHYVAATAGTCTLVDAPCTTKGLDGSQVSVGLAYHFSRPTYVFGMASWVRNGPSARFQEGGVQDVNVGEDLTQYAVGIHHAFEVSLHERH
jgi:predicted porin